MTGCSVLFDRLDELVSNDSFRGCRYFATDLAFAEPGHPAHAETETFRRRLHALLVESSRRWATATRSVRPNSCTC